MNGLYARLAPWLLLIVELGVVLGAAAMIFVAHRRATGSSQKLSGFRWLETVWGRLARRKTLSVIIVGLLALTLRIALMPILGTPQPAVHD